MGRRRRRSDGIPLIHLHFPFFDKNENPKEEEEGEGKGDLYKASTTMVRQALSFRLGQPTLRRSYLICASLCCMLHATPFLVFPRFPRCLSIHSRVVLSSFLILPKTCSFVPPNGIASGCDSGIPVFAGRRGDAGACSFPSSSIPVKIGVR